MSTLIRLMVVFLLSQGALAKSPTEGAPDCSALLSQRASPLDYAVSDLEGLFFELVQKVQSAHEVQSSRREFFIKDILAMKAQILNRIVGILPVVAMGPDDNPKKAAAMNSIYQIIESLGVPPEMYGLKLDDQFQVIIPQAPPAKRVADKREVVNAPIGFVTTSEGLGRDLPEGVHRSIGFGTERIEAYAPPRRSTGHIKRTVFAENKNVLVITDGETKSDYAVDVRILSSHGANLEDKQFLLEFSREMREWIVRVENVNNPSGHIGFLN